jgi:hypothetical protein
MQVGGDKGGVKFVSTFHPAKTVETERKTERAKQ